MTTIDFAGHVITFDSSTKEHLYCPMSLDALASRLVYCDQARIILAVRHLNNMPSNIRGVLKK